MARNAYGFAIGIPTTVDVDLLMKAFGVPAAGTNIPYADVEAVIHVGAKSNRFRTVTVAWRKKLERENNIVMDANPVDGFVILTNVGRVGNVARKVKASLRAMGVAGRRAASTARDGVSIEQSRTLDHAVTLCAAVRVQSAMEARKLRAMPEHASE